MTMNSDKSHFRQRKNLAWGVVLVLVGAFFLAKRMDLLDLAMAWQYWPLAIALVGLVEIICATATRHVVSGCINIVIGCWLYAVIENLWGWTFSTTWPVLLIGIGASMLIGSLVDSVKRRQ